MKIIKIGDVYGRWSVIGRRHESGYWPCKCSCGTLRNIKGENLTNKNSLSCGCFHKELISSRNVTHSPKDSREFYIWQKLIHDDPDRVCTIWVVSFDTFLQDVGKKPVGATLTLIDKDGNYEPGNARWTISECKTSPTS